MRDVTRQEWLVVVLLTLAAFGLRGAYPAWLAVEHFDEGVYASNLWFGAADDYQYPNQFYYAPPLLPRLIEWLFVLFGPSNRGTMLANIFAGTLTVPLVWWVTRRWFGRMAGLTAALLATFSDVHIFFSRTALTDVLLCFWLLAAVYFVWQAIALRGWFSIVAAGVATGLAWWTKYNGWLPLAIGLAGMIPWVLLHATVRRTGWRHLATWVLIAFMAGLVWSPFLWELDKHGGYAAVAANHRTYLVGLGGWTTSLRQQVANLSVLGGWLTALSLGATATVALGLCVDGGKRFTWNARGGRWGVLGVGLLVAGLAAATGATILLAVGALAGIAGVLVKNLRRNRPASSEGGVLTKVTVESLEAAPSKGVLQAGNDVSKEIVFASIEQALLSAARKHYGKQAKLHVRVDRESDTPILKVDGKQIDPQEMERLLGRTTARAAKEIMLRKIREAEKAGPLGGLDQTQRDQMHRRLASMTGGSLKVDAVLSPPSMVEGEHSNRQSLAGWLLAAWFIGLTVSTPFYTPFPRLALPWIVASWIGTGAAAGLVASWIGRRAALPVEPAAKRGWRMAAMYLLSAVAGVSLLGWRSADLNARGVTGWESRMGLSLVTKEIVTTACWDAHLTPDQARDQMALYVYGEPALLFQLKLAGIEHAVPVMHLGFARPGARASPLPTFVVTGPHADQTASFAEQLKEGQARMKLIGVFTYLPSKLVVLDSREGAERVGQSQLRELERLRLYRVE